VLARFWHGVTNRLQGSLLRKVSRGARPDETAKRQNDRNCGPGPPFLFMLPRMPDSSTPSSGCAPLASVLMPVRGCRDTLPMAVASVLAQTMDDWELLVVIDDDKGGLEWLAALDDSRIRVLRSGAPGGRGAARQAGLEAARGEYLAFLDADDWMLPDRLEVQAAALDCEPDLALISGGMVVPDRDERPVGMRRIAMDSGTTQVAPARLATGPTLSASSMLRTALAKQTGYDARMPVGEDADFFARCLAGRAYRQEAVPVYCYREFASFSVAGLRAGLAADRCRRLRQASGTPDVLRVWVGWIVKRTAYAAALAAFGRDWVLRRRCRAMTQQECAQFEEGRARVLEMLERIRDTANP